MNVMYMVFIWSRFKILNWLKDTQSRHSRPWYISGIIFWLSDSIKHFNCSIFYLFVYDTFDYCLKYFIKIHYTLYRNGNPLLFEGDLQNEESILEWLIDDENRELADEIESVNERMLERLLYESHLLAVFFYTYIY